MIFKINKLIPQFIFLILTVFVFNFTSFGQKIKINNIEKYNNLKWEDWVLKIEKDYKLNFYYNPDSIPNFTVIIKNDSTLFKNQLNQILQPFKIKASIDQKGNVFLLKNHEIKTNIFSSFYKKEKYSTDNNNSVGKYLITKNEIITKTKIVGDKNKKVTGDLTVTGVVKDFYKKTIISGATIFISELNKALYSDENGEFSINIKKGEYIFILESPESRQEKYKVTIYSSGRLDFYLETNLISIDEVVISSNQYHNVKSNQMGFENISAKLIEIIPSVLGERDIIKVSLLLPGIQSVGEGSAGINVRGSPADQNIFYLNHIPIYNTSHFFGFFTSVNSDAIDNLTIYKSNIPAEYGGKLSSVININAKTGDLKKFKASGGINPITGRLMIEGPLKKDKGSFLIAARSTYSDWILKFIQNEDISNSKIKFADGIVNISYEINQNNHLKLTGYYSFDKVNFAERNKYDYQNKGLSFSLKHFFNKKLKTEFFIIHSEYSSTDENYEDPSYPFKQNFKINHDELKIKNSYNINSDHLLVFGFNSIYYTLDKGSYIPLNLQLHLPQINFGISKALENGIFLNHEWNISPSISLLTGVRYNIYSKLGPEKVFKYEKNSVINESSIIDTVNYSNNKIIKTYQNPDIRISGKYIINEDFSVKVGYNSIHQYTYMLSNTIAISPFYKWQLSDYHIKPMSGQQLTVGFYSNFLNNNYEFSFETYYKKIKNLIQFKDGANITFNKYIETDILQGDLDSYGFEFMLKKKFGKLNGWINYTFSNAQNIVKNPILENNINYGLPYNADYDKPHAFNLVANYEIVKRFSASANFVYSTGRPITYPTGVYYYSGVRVFNYTKRNEYRIPDYVRLDISFKIEGNLRSKKLIHGTWIFSVYNLLGRNNAYAIFFKNENGLIKSYKLSIFANPVVSLSYNFNLGNYENK